MQISFYRLFAKKLHFVSLCQRLSKKLNFIKIWQVEVGQNKNLVCFRKKQLFRQRAWGLRQLVLKSGFRPKGRALGMLKKSKNFNSLRPILFELCKRNYRGGGQIDPPPAGIGLKNFVLFSMHANVYNNLMEHCSVRFISRTELTSIHLERYVHCTVHIQILPEPKT